MRNGFTLVEMMIALTVGAAVMILILASFRSLSTSLAATEHYRSLHRAVRHAIDIMQRDIAAGSGVSACTTNSSLTLTTGSNNVSVVYNLANHVLSRKVGTGSAETLATGVVDKITFTLYDASGAVTADPAGAYFVDVKMEMKAQGVRDTYADELQMRSRMRSKGL